MSKKTTLTDNQADDPIQLNKGEWCPFCNKTIYPSNVDDFMEGLADSLVYVHDDVKHDEDFDFTAMH